MANTTNFGWETPDDTDLVKDGAAAMRTLGNAIDASLVDLKGGTTGQVLSKNTNTDMDFTWVTTDDANAIQNAIVDAKGDLIAASAADTPARLAVGSNGDTLVSDSSTTTGLRWQEPKAGNPVINSAFQVWQRGTAATAIATSGVFFLADRWQAVRGGGSSGGTISRQTTSDTTNLPNIQYCARVQRDSGNTSTATIVLGQNFETVNSIPFAGKTVTLSFYARAGANYSPTSSALKAVLQTGTGTDQNGITSGYTGSATPINSNVTLTTTWQRFSLTGTIAATATEICLTFEATPVGTAGANDWFEITGVQLEVGSVATAFKTQGVTLAGELAACQRYYWRSSNNSAYAGVGLGIARETNAISIQVTHPVTMRGNAPVLEFSNLQYSDGVGTIAMAAPSVAQSSSRMAVLDEAVSGATQYRPYFLRNANNTAGYIAFSMEL